MSDEGHRFVLFAHPRSGSTNLLQALRQHPEIRIAEEPFHKCYHSWVRDEPNYVDLISDVSTLERQLAALYAKYDGIKVLDYQLAKELYTHLLLKPDIKVIALRRRNLLQSIISRIIAQQNGIWIIRDTKGSLDDSYRMLEPASIDDARGSIAGMLELRAFYIRVLSRKPPEMCLNLEYETLYTSSVEENMERLTNVLNFLGFEARNLETAAFYLDPRKSKINNAQSYRRLPNAKQINDHLGCDETGWLFEKG